jgi:hypothetical protein
MLKKAAEVISGLFYANNNLILPTLAIWMITILPAAIWVRKDAL